MAQIDLVHFDLDKEGKAEPAIAGGYVPVLVRVTYPGSRCSDILIGDRVIQIANQDLAHAFELHESNCDTEGG